MTPPLRLLLADAQMLFAENLQLSLTRHGHTVLGVATARAELVPQASSERPDICLMEAEFPDGDGIEVVTELRQCTKVIVLTADSRPETIRRALAAGALGFVHKRRGLSTVLDVIDRVTAGGRVVAGDLPARPRNETPAKRQLLDQISYLTPRELECLKLLAAGVDTMTMARRLGVSATTVRTHTQAVLTKLGAHSRLEAASLALRHGLLEGSA
jgi:DNA-binding NarL/FixJ family response regulator